MEKKKEILFCDYYEEWIETYKVGAIREITLNKYYVAFKFLKINFPKLFMSDLDKLAYQRILNLYAETHEKQTTKDFHHHIKGAIQDAFDEHLIDRDPTRKAVIKGKEPREKKIKYLNKEDLMKLTAELELTDELNNDWLILLIAKTGLRFAEALALTPDDFDFKNGRLTINKTWDYKSASGKFAPTKNTASIRDILIDRQIRAQFERMLTDLPVDEPIFVEKLDDDKYKRVFNSTLNNRMSVLCKRAGVPVITVHGLRHTHASMLLVDEISIQMIAQRLGHATTTTTQETYLHIIKELEQKDEQKMMSALSSIA